jgi:Ca2+-binding RTX toxin-like protein
MRLRGMALAIGIAVALSMTGAGSVSASKPMPRCLGMAATIVGTSQVDTIRGTPADDVIVGGGDANGDDVGDTIYGLGGNDRICASDDAVYTFVHGGGGDDRIQASGVMFGGPGDDTLSDPWVDDPLDPGLVGGPGDDVLRSRTTDVTLFVPGPGDDTVAATDPEAGNLVWFRRAARGVVVDLRAGTAVGDGHDALSGINAVEGTPYADILLGGPGTEGFLGHAGNDVAIGRGGDDGLSGGPGDDRVDGGPGSDSLDGGHGRDDLLGRRGNDHLFETGGREPNLILAGPGRDTCRGNYHVPPSIERGCESHGPTHTPSDDHLTGSETRWRHVIRLVQAPAT